MRTSNWVHLPQKIGVNINKYVSCHHLVMVFGTQLDPKTKKSPKNLGDILRLHSMAERREAPSPRSSPVDPQNGAFLLWFQSVSRINKNKSKQTHYSRSMYCICTYIYHKNQPNVGKYTSPMDPMGNDLQWKPGWPTVCTLQFVTLEPWIRFNSATSFLAEATSRYIPCGWFWNPRRENQLRWR